MADDEDALPDESWDSQARHETPTERLDRNWTELLQELRVLQTGVQFLTGFLLTLPFQTRFARLSDALDALYLGCVASAVFATGLLVAPVGVHRALFRRHARRVTVDAAARLAQGGMVFLGLSIVGVAALIFSVVSGTVAGWVAGAAAALTVVTLWWVLPHRLDRLTSEDQLNEPPRPRHPDH